MAMRACAAVVRRSWLRAAVAVLLALGASAHAADRPRTCLVLGGGGARGAAHIGVLKVLERQHIPVDCVVGTSMGAVVGGLYASGYSAAQIEAILDGIDWRTVLSDDPSRSHRSMRAKEDDLRFLGGIEVGIRHHGVALPQGLRQGQNLDLLLRRLLLKDWRVHDFDHLPIPFRAVAADIGSGEKVVFSQGDIVTAIRASMSIPGAFAPVKQDGRLLVDGGMVDNVPIDVARQMGAQRMIVVDVGSGLEPVSKLDSPFAVARQMLVAVLKRESDAKLKTLGPQDLLIAPDLGTLASEDFDRVTDALRAGERSADAVQTPLRRFTVPEAEYAAIRQGQQSPDTGQAPVVAFVEVPHGSSKTAEHVRHRMSSAIGKPLDVDEVEKSVTAAYGQGHYQTIQWAPIEKDGQTGLLVEPEDKSWGPDFLRTSLRLSDDFTGNSSYQLLSEFNATGLNSLGGEARARLGLGRLTNIHLEFHQPWGDQGQFSAAPYVDYRAYNLPLTINSKLSYAVLRRSDRVGGFRLGWAPDNDWNISAAIERGEEKLSLRVGDPNVFKNSFSNRIASVSIDLLHDTLDSSGFPQRGNRLYLSERQYLTALGSVQNASVRQARWDGALTFGRSTFLLGASYSASGGGEDIVATYSPLGGLTHLSGYPENAILADTTFLGRLVYYRRMTAQSALASFPVYLGGSAELGAWGPRGTPIFRRSMTPAGSIFVGVDTLFGPVLLGYGRAKGNASAFYLTFGPLLRTETD